jgi:hypothetical protein
MSIESGRSCAERTRHTDLRYFWHKEQVDAGEAIVKHIFMGLCLYLFMGSHIYYTTSVQLYYAMLCYAIVRYLSRRFP